MLAMCKSVLNYGKIDTLRETYNQIENITTEELLIVAREVFSAQKLSLIEYIG
jgi:hypothetical protein